MYSLCRLCLRKSENCVSLFKENGKNMVESLTSLKIQKDKNLPLGACKTCWKNIKLAYRIQQDILANNEKLQLIDFPPDLEIDQFLNLETENLVDEPADASDDDEDVEKVVIKIKDEFSEQGTDFWDVISFMPLVAKCSVCGDEFTENEMDVHVKKHFYQSQNCEICNETFENIHFYQSHKLKEHALQAKKSFRCDLCRFSFRYASFYNMHLEKLHVSDKQIPPSEQIKCTICDGDVSFKSKLDRQNHYASVHGYNLIIKKYCPFCQIDLEPRHSKAHMSTHTQPTLCHICGLVSINIQCLNKHISRRHSAQANTMYKCEYCDKTFANKLNCKSHMSRYHLNTAEHICEVCGKFFYRAESLNKHMKMIHIKLRPHVCEYCGKSFFSKFLLRAHLRQHTNDAPYRCDECGEAFKHNVSLKTHKRSKHNMEEEKKVLCKICGKGFASDMAVSCHIDKKHKYL